MMDEKIYTPSQIAEALQVSEKTINRWINAGALKAIKVGRLWRIPESDFQAFLEQNKTSH